VFIDFRAATELVLTAVLVASLLVSTTADNFNTTLDKQVRSTLYGSLAGTCAALLGFVLAALAILAALPSTEQLEKLQGHPKWPRVPSAFFRAARALLGALVLATLGIALDSDKDAWHLYEVATVVVLSLALVRVAAAVAALDSVLAVARTMKKAAPG
jgi:peptidoglycan/LPS O-acetylase OafA/YrhL